MDETDAELLTSVDSGITKYTALAKKLNMNLSTVHFRMKKLEREGVIKHYKGEVDWSKAGFPLVSFILINIDVNLLKKLGKTQDRLLKELLSLTYVREGYIITGDQDIMVKVIAKDPTHLKDILLNHIDTKEGVVKTKTVMVLN